jgi:hypothetical protein
MAYPGVSTFENDSDSARVVTALLLIITTESVRYQNAILSCTIFIVFGRAAGIIRWTESRMHNEQCVVSAEVLALR